MYRDLLSILFIPINKTADKSVAKVNVYYDKGGKSLEIENVLLKRKTVIG